MGIAGGTLEFSEVHGPHTSGFPDYIGRMMGNCMNCRLGRPDRLCHHFSPAQMSWPSSVKRIRFQLTLKPGFSVQLLPCVVQQMYLCAFDLPEIPEK